MKRTVVKVVLHLLLGAVINVALAWGCAAWAPLSADALLFESKDEDDATQFWRRYVPSSLGNEPMWGFQFTGPGLDLSMIELDFPLNSTPDFYGDYNTLFVVRSGWPWRSMAGFARWITTDGSALRNLLPIPGELSFGTGTSSKRFIPVRPIAAGFVLNTVCFAALSSLVFSGLFALRRLIRRRHGLCVNCAYDLRDGKQDVCSECGQAIK